MNHTTSAFELFQGDWLIERTITGSVSGRFSGKASIKPKAANQLIFHESGQLLTDGKVLDCDRQYLIERLGLRTIAINFSDGRKFLNLNFSERLNAQGKHICELDTYNATYEFVSAQKLLVSFEVYGPQKNYKIQSTFMKS